MNDRQLTAAEKISLSMSTTPPQMGPSTGSIFMRGGPGGLHNTFGMNIDQINALVAQWNAMPDAQKVGMALTDL